MAPFRFIIDVAFARQGWIRPAEAPYAGIKSFTDTEHIASTLSLELQGEQAISAKVFVGNLTYTTTEGQLADLLSEAGQVVDVYLPADRNTGRPRGFAFVEFSSPSEAEQCIEKFNEYELDGRKLNINIAEDRPRRPAPRPGGPPGGGGGGNRFAGRGGAPAKPSRPKGSRRGKRGKKRSL